MENRKFLWDEYGDQITVAEGLRRAETPEYHRALPGKENFVSGEYSDGMSSFGEGMESSDMPEVDEGTDFFEASEDFESFGESGDASFEEQFGAEVELVDLDKANTSFSQEQIEQFIDGSGVENLETLRQMREIVAGEDSPSGDATQYAVTR